MNYRKFKLEMLHTDQSVVIYGAQAVAYTTYRAIVDLKRSNVKYFVVTDKTGQPDSIEGVEVIELSDYSEKYSEEQRKRDAILIATPESVQHQIAETLQSAHLNNFFFITSETLGSLQEALFGKEDMFPSVKGCKPSIAVYQAMHEKDRLLTGVFHRPSWIVPIQVGASRASRGICSTKDNTGDNISDRNSNYSELTALYWAWKNSTASVKGLCHYRRVPDLSNEDLLCLSSGTADVVLTYPMLYYPNIAEHHKRYLTDSEWETVEETIDKLAPKYANVLQLCMNQQYFINYNIIVARAEVFDDYCSWLFPILFEIGKNTEPREDERNDRYMGYIGENLCTIYFSANKEKIKARYCGCLMGT